MSITIEQVVIVATATIAALFVFLTVTAELGRLIVGRLPRIGEAMIRIGTDGRGFLQAIASMKGTASVSAPRIDEAAPAIAHAQAKGFVPSSTATDAVVASTIAQGKVDAAERKADEPPVDPPAPLPPPLPAAGRPPSPMDGPST